MNNLKTNRRPVSTETHSTRFVAEHFLKWREQLKKNSKIGHNGGPPLD